MHRSTRIFWIAILLTISACSGEQLHTALPGEKLSDEQAARRVLITFFDHLHSGEYTSADDLYAGPRSHMIDLNPSLDPADHVALWEAACLWNGAICLTVRTAKLAPDPEPFEGEFVFLTEFNEEDGSLFTLGPCCGADPDEFPPTSVFTFRVRKTAEHQFQVITPPVYGP